MIVTIVLGILGLGIVVFVHEFGHFIVAKASGITVEAFSIGWGKILFSKKWRGTEYRLSLLPIGGYCKMKGEELFKKALDEKADKIPHEEGSLFSVPVWKRMLTYAAGPFFNFLFAVLVLSVIWFSGFTIHTYENRIIMLSDYPALFEAGSFPADEAGLRTGDRIIGIEGEEIDSYYQIRQLVAKSPQDSLSMTIQRGQQKIDTTITPELNRDTGAGRIGVAAWTEPVLSAVQDGQSASVAGLQEGDRILSANGQEIRNSLEFYAIIAAEPAKIDITYQRSGQVGETVLIPLYDEEGQANLGMGFRGISRKTPDMGPIQALAKGTSEAVETFLLTIKGIIVLFSGVDVQKAVSGPVRITYLVGEIASQGFEQGVGSGFLALFRFLSLLSVALCFGNLLPIPALDGGLILLSTVELIKGSSVSPKTFYRYQTVGFMIIMVILFLTTFSDISYLFSR